MNHHLNVCDIDGARGAPVDVVTFGGEPYPIAVTRARFAGIGQDEFWEE